MSTISRHSTNRFTQLIINLLKTRLRIDRILDNIILLISISKTTNISRIDRNILYRTFQSQNDIIKILKLSILLQRAIVQGYVPDCDKLVQILLTKVDDAVSQHFGSEGTKFIKEKIVRPYLNYLQKRIFQDKNISNFEQYTKQTQTITLEKQSPKIEKLLLQKIKIDKNKQIIRKYDKPTYYNSPNPIQPNLTNPQYDQKQLKNLSKILHKCFYLINLLKKCVYVCPAMMIMIRYYGGYYGCILDFNIVLAMDIEIIYCRLCYSVNQVNKYLKKIQNLPKSKEIQDLDKVIKQLQDIRIMIKEIQIIHQGIQLIYYNCYHYKNLTNYAPKLINTQKYFSKIQAIKKQCISQLKWYKILSQIRSLSFQYKQKQCSKIMLNSLNYTLRDHTINNRSTYRKNSFNKSHYIQQNQHFKPVQTFRVRQQMILQPEQQTDKIQCSNTIQKQIQLIQQITITASTWVKTSGQKSNEEQVAKQQEKDIFEFVESQNQSSDDIEDHLDQQCQNSKMDQNITLLMEMSRIFQDMNKIKLEQNN